MDQSLPQLALGYVPAQIVYATAELGIPDALAAGATALGDIADRTGTDAAALRRLLRALVPLGLVTQLSDDRFALTESGRPLRTDVPDTMRSDLMLSLAPVLWRAWGELARIVRTGEAARDAHTGLTAYETLIRQPDTAAQLRSQQAQASAGLADGVVRAADVARFDTIADLGGDDGTLMAAILAAAPGLRGVVYDSKDALAAVTATVEKAGVADRCEVVEAEPTGSVPVGAYAYLLNNVIRNCDDGHATATLRRCHDAMGAHARLLLVETVMPSVLTPEQSAAYGLTDLNNLVFAGGRERTRGEFGELLGAAGFRLVSVTDVPAGAGIPDCHLIEAEPRLRQLGASGANPAE